MPCRILCVIPSRIGSTRIPRKPLLTLHGKPMVQWVYENASRCKLVTKVVVATDCEEIAEVITHLGGKAVMTDPDIATGSDRVAHVAALYPDMDVVINLQGDEPFINPAMLEQLVAPYIQGDTPDMTTLAAPLDWSLHYTNPGAVKVITDLSGNALYFSRAEVPHLRTAKEGPLPVYHHIGLYAFRYHFLQQYLTLPQTPLEKIESLEQLRALEHGFRIRVCLTESKTIEINTVEEYEQAQQFALTF